MCTVYFPPVYEVFQLQVLHRLDLILYSFLPYKSNLGAKVLILIEYRITLFIKLRFIKQKKHIYQEQTANMDNNNVFLTLIS